VSPSSFGLVVPPATGVGSPDPESVWKLAEEADDSSLEYLWVSDHIVWYGPMHDSLTLLTAIAARTHRVRIGTAVLLLAMRHPVLVAKAIASLELLSGSRLTLGVGVGGEYPPEWKAVDIDWKTRASRTDEMIEALRGLWRDGSFSFEGRRLTIDDVDLHPKLARPVPIWIGGRKDAALKRAGRFGDGWMGIFTTPERFKAQFAKVQEEAGMRGRDPSAIVPSLYVWTSIADDHAQARSVAESLLPLFYNTPWEKLEKYAVFGTPSECAERFAEFADAGVSHFAVAPIDSDGLGMIRRLEEEVAPALSPKT
jgi:probable F420-dependent oxidoreductase